MNQLTYLAVTGLKIALAAFVAFKLVVIAVAGLFFGALLRRLYRSRAGGRRLRSRAITRQRKRVRTASVVE